MGEVRIEREYDEKGNWIDIMLKKQEEEKSAETIRLTFTGECFCGNVVTTEAEVPKEPAPEVKRDETGRRYRDWDYPEFIPCGKCTSDITGETRFVQVYYREYLD